MADNVPKASGGVNEIFKYKKVLAILLGHINFLNCDSNKKIQWLGNQSELKSHIYIVWVKRQMVVS